MVAIRVATTDECEVCGCLMMRAQVWFNEMQISVDRRQLLSEHQVPVSLVGCLRDALLRCGCSSPPCCDHSVLGSWSGRLLWVRLPRRADNVDVPRGADNVDAVRTTACCTWRSLARSLGWTVVVIVVLPLPYYIRLGVFYAVEVWYPESTSDVSELERVWKRATKFIPELSKRSLNS